MTGVTDGMGRADGDPGTGAAPALWSSRLAFILAAVGSAVGLGNIWKFPYMAGTGGGSAFVLVYLGCVLLVGVPVLMSELMLGRMARRGPITALADLGRRFGGTPAWGLVGAIGVLAAILILSFYSVVAGWALAYVPKLAAGAFTGADAERSGAAFAALLADPAALFLWHTLFIGLTVAIVMRGVRSGIEVAVTWLMPLLFIMLLILVGYAVAAGDFARGAAYLFTPDFSKVTPGLVIAAAGQAFFSLSLGLGAMLAYGAYLPDDVSIPRTAVTIAAADTACALAAGLAIFPIVFAHGLDPAEGPGLVFVTLPVAFGGMPFGALFGTVFFVLIGIAALTSAVALLEPAVAALQDRVRIGRVGLTAGFGAFAWLFGLLTVFSFNVWADVRPFGDGRTLFDLIDWFTANLLIPLGATLIAVFTGWVVTREAGRTALGLPPGAAHGLWLALVRYVAPIAILVIAWRKIVG